MADSSWGTPPPAGARAPSLRDPVRLGADQRAAARALERDATATQRHEARAARAEADLAARERERTARREREIQAAPADIHAAAASRHRSSGRKDVVREQRDTRGYATVVDADRIRELARRGASLSGLAGAFGITEDQIAAILEDAA